MILILLVKVMTHLLLDVQIVINIPFEKWFPSSMTGCHISMLCKIATFACDVRLTRVKCNATSNTTSQLPK
jgi:hypothetical protein